MGDEARGCAAQFGAVWAVKRKDVEEEVGGDF